MNADGGSPHLDEGWTDFPVMVPMMAFPTVGAYALLFVERIFRFFLKIST